MYISKDRIKEKFQHGGWSTRRILTWKRSSQRKDKILNSIQARAIKWSMDQLVRRFPSLETDRPLETGLRIRGTRKFNGLSAVRCPRGGSSKNTSRTERVPFARRNEKRASKVDDGGRKRRRRRRRGMKRKGSCQFPVEFTLRSTDEIGQNLPLSSLGVVANKFSVSPEIASLKLSQTQ